MKRNLTNLLKLKKENNKDKEIVWKYLQDLPFSLKDKKDAIDLLFDQAQNQGGDSSEQSLYKDVNFIDCDGTVLYAYTWDEWEKVNKLPPIPTEIKHTDNYGDVECRGWNWDLEGINFHNRRYIVNEQGFCITFVESGQFDGFGEVDFYGYVYCDELYAFAFTKKNAKIGDYIYVLNEDNTIESEMSIIKTGRVDCKVDVGAIYGNDSFGNIKQIYKGVHILDIMCETYDISGRHDSIDEYVKIVSYAFYLNEYLEKEIITTINNTSFNNNYVDRLSLPINIKFSGGYGALGLCHINDLNLNYIFFNINSFLDSSFKDTKFITPINVNHIPAGCFEKTNLTYIKFNSNVFEIYSLKMGSFGTILDFTEYKFVPALISNDANTIRFIIVPDDLLNEWMVATNWSVCGDKIISKSKYEDLINGRLEVNIGGPV